MLYTYTLHTLYHHFFYRSIVTLHISNLSTKPYRCKLLQLIGITTINRLDTKYPSLFKSNATNKAFITTGIFRFTRNPVYLALIIVQIGFGFIVDSGWFFVMVLMLFALLNHYIIPNEEKMLEESFGEEYWEYKGRVRRWV
ncbi:MAG: isoprenylcysteine carboxylmethyltransferase family protein [Campylobacterota bacterium]|nr:isoprenylcysteine carboxylmethyltransferase family protein [Campylobacterota bacterium]